MAPVPPPRDSLVRRWVVPPALFAGVAFAFLVCCLAGWVVSRQTLYRNFVRTHQHISPEGAFHPTISQFRAVAKETAADQVIVIVGGSSVLHGAGQGRDAVWTLRLQEQLGDAFRVFNFALRAGAYSEAGALVAESLIKDGQRVIYVADTAPAVAVPPLRGFLYEYMFWDAYEKGLLLEDPTREASVRALIGQATGVAREARNERRLGARLDRYFRFNDLWSTIAYRWAFTVWSSLSSDRPFAPRKVFVDPETGPLPPFPQRYLEEHLVRSLTIIRSFAPGRITLDALGRPTADPSLPAWRAFRAGVETDLPRLLRERTLLLVDEQSPYYLDMLAPEERHLYDLVVDRTVMILREAGYESLTMSRRLTIDDFYDRTHLTPAGGTKLADTVAPVVRQMVERLGYLR